METALSVLQRMVLLGIAIFSLYGCFQIKDTGWLARPAAGWTVVVVGFGFVVVGRVVDCNDAARAWRQRAAPDRKSDAGSGIAGFLCGIPGAFLDSKNLYPYE